MSTRAEWPRPAGPPEWTPPGRPDLPPTRRPQPQPLPMIAPPMLPTDGDVLMHLLQRRIVLLTGPIDLDQATAVVAQLLLVDGDNHRPVQLHLSCGDADLEAAVLLADAIDLMGSEVHALATGVVGGPAVAVFASARKRAAHLHASFLLRESRVGLVGTADQVAGHADQHRRQLRLMVERIAAVTGRPVDRVAADVRTGLVLTAEAAVDYGLVETIRQ